MFQKMLSWIKNNNDPIHATAAIVQTVIAICMLVTLFQTGKAISLSRMQLAQNEQSLKNADKQLQSIIEPVVVFSQNGSKISVENAGVVGISHLDIISHAALIFDINKHEATWVCYNTIPYGRERLAENMEPGGLGINLDLSYYALPHIPETSTTELEADCLLISYRRTVDFKQFYYPLFYLRSVANKEALYIPFVADNQGATMPKFSGKDLFHTEIRDIFSNIYMGIYGRPVMASE